MIPADEARDRDLGAFRGLLIGAPVGAVLWMVLIVTAIWVLAAIT